MTHFMITGCATKDGHPIYLLTDGTWTEQFANAHVIDDQEQCKARLERAQSDAFNVCDPYSIEVIKGEHGPEPTSLRERIRANGPTIQYR